MNKVIFITGNKEKFIHMDHILSPYGIVLEQRKMETPEIQSMDVKEVAEFSARWAAHELGAACLVTDVGCYVEALGGFPGPFVKFVNEALPAAKLLKLMEGEVNRRATFRECISFCSPGGTPVSFIREHPGEIVHEAGGDEALFGKKAPFNEIMIFEGCDRVMAAYSYDEMMRYFEGRHTHFHAFGEWYQARGQGVQ